MKLKDAVFLFAVCMALSTTATTVPVFSAPPYYHEEGNVNYLGSYNESGYIAAGIGVDDYITMVDLVILDRAWASMYPDPRYNPDADMIEDGFIDAEDLWVIGSHWGLNYQYSPFQTIWARSPVVKVIAPAGVIVVGEEFVVDIAIENVEGLNAYEFTLSWHPASLVLMSVKGGGFISKENEIIPSGISGAGYVYVGDALAGGSAPLSQSGSGILAKITFKCLVEGTTALDLSSRLFDVSPYIPLSMPHEDQDDVVSTLTVQELTQGLIATIETWNLPAGTERSLTLKLEDVLRLLEKGNENGAVRKLADFIKQVDALRNDKLTDEQADYLISEAQRIIGLIQS